MGTIPSKTDRATVDGTEYVAGAAGGSDVKVLLSKVKDYVLTFFSNKTQLDKISESGGLPQYDSKPFGSLVQVADIINQDDDFSISLAYSRVARYELNAAQPVISFTNITKGSIVVVLFIAQRDLVIEWNEDHIWARGDVLESLDDGQIARLFIASDGTTAGNIYISYELFEETT
jgi:hypothetical protein